MFRLVLLTSLGVFAVQPVFAQETPQAQMSSGLKPGSSIAFSSFALAQRDEARETPSTLRPVLQASVPTENRYSLVSVKSVAPLPAMRPIGMGLSQQPSKIPLQTAPIPIPANAPVPQLETKNNPLATKADNISSRAVSTSRNPAAQPKILASREALRQRALLSRLDADLASAQPGLDRAQARLLQSQRQLGAFTSALSSAMMEAGDEGNGLHPFVRVAQRYLGTPYVWGGESARGFDCSGFIMRVMRDLGYRALPHSAAEQFHYGTPIARELLKPGDVVFFANTYKPGISHVGIYLGKGRFIHAANSKVGTIVSDLNQSKWIAHYAGARRLVRVGS
ncbi:MAG: peptidoglycan endopeptidase [Cytophagaceae bacterium]|nr:MAG: peptidoglycan endopeptidase [Cytophagaceae bacterium]